MHIHAGMFPYVNIYKALMQAYSCGYDPAFDCIMGMIAPMFAYTCGQNSACACMYMQAKFRPLGAYSTRACGNENTKSTRQDQMQSS